MPPPQPKSTRPTSHNPVGGKVVYELITLGDELLLGLTANGHLTFIGSELGRRGVQLTRNVTITDDAMAIGEQFRESWARARVVITTGGLGPTCDDRTREVIAETLGQKLVRDDSIVEAIKERFAQFGRPMTDNNLKQAFRFEGGEIIPNANGTAPGLWFEEDGKVLVMLPGPPNELQPMFTDQVLPKLAELGLVAAQEAYVQIRTAGVGESSLETKFQPIFEANKDKVSVAFCAHEGQVDCRLSAARDDVTREELQRVAEECVLLLKEDFMGFGHDGLAKICADLLRDSESTLAVAETSTGGLLAASFTNLSGATKFFAGGSVCYSNQSKMQLLDVPEEILMQHGAVSAENAVAMAAGAAEKLGADYGLAITGFAGPCGGTNENPVGTMYIALYSPDGVWSKRVRYPGPRQTVKRRTINMALDWLRREIVRARDGRKRPQKRVGFEN
jgi:nicotinamide-nucleotide amidase